MNTNNALKLNKNSERRFLLTDDIQREIDLCKAKIAERAQKKFLNEEEFVELITQYDTIDHIFTEWDTSHPVTQTIALLIQDLSDLKAEQIPDYTPNEIAEILFHELKCQLIEGKMTDYEFEPVPVSSVTFYPPGHYYEQNLVRIANTIEEEIDKLLDSDPYDDLLFEKPVEKKETTLPPGFNNAIDACIDDLEQYATENNLFINDIIAQICTYDNFEQLIADQDLLPESSKRVIISINKAYEKEKLQKGAEIDGDFEEIVFHCIKNKLLIKSTIRPKQKIQNELDNFNHSVHVEIALLSPEEQARYIKMRERNQKEYGFSKEDLLDMACKFYFDDENIS
ncbi:hypothetical protein GF340_03965 [Candidatus Peregrinibacteria bacterium]|nr:hypothetical protein [Candidatus Peregrinibacteria bacterium]